MKSFRIGLLAAVGLTIPLATASVAAPAAAPVWPAPVMINGKPCVAVPIDKIGIQTFSLPGFMTGPASITTVEQAEAARVAAAAARAAAAAANPQAAAGGGRGGAAAPGGAPGGQAAGGTGRGPGGAAPVAAGAATGAPATQAAGGRAGGAAPAGAAGGRAPTPANLALIDSTFAWLRQAGFRNIETAGSGRYGLTAPQMMAALNKHGLKAIGDHGSIREADIDASIEYALAVGQNKFIGASGWQYGNDRDIAGVRAAAAGLNAAGKKAFDKGLTLYVHNHRNEFNMVDYDLDKNGVAEQVPALAALMDLTDPRYVNLEIDIHWIIQAYLDRGQTEQEALAFTRRWQDRVVLYHVKETNPAVPGGEGYLGQGITNWPAWWAAGPKVQYYLYEMDGPPNPLEYARVAANWMNCRAS